MGEQLARAYDLVQSVVVDPTSNLTVAVLLMAMLIIFVLLISTAIYLLLVLHPERPGQRVAGATPGGAVSGVSEAIDDDVVGETAVSSRKRGLPSARYLVVGLVVLLVTCALTYGLTGADSFCEKSCHADSAAVVSADVDAHVSVSCATCHEAGGLAAIPANIAWRFQFLAAQLVGGTVTQRPVRAERCLGCHERILDGVIENAERGLRMEHASPTQAGMSCEDCHENVGHGTVLSAGMNPCLRCHDGEQASAECSTCHLSDPAQAAVADRPFPKVRVANRDCGGCHDLAPCDACHGTRMPHSETFTAYAHAKDAVFERKESCYLCHEESDCGACHSGWDLGHGATVAARRRDHLAKMDRAAFYRTASCACHGHNPYRNYCAICHEEAGSVF